MLVVNAHKSVNLGKYFVSIAKHFKWQITLSFRIEAE